MPAFDLLNLADARTLAEHLLRSEDQSLGSPEALQEPKAARFDTPIPIPDLKIGAKLTLAGSLEIQLFNENTSTDKDETGIYGDAPGKPPELPYIGYNPKTAWLRYTALLKGDASGGATIPLGGWASLGIELGATGSATLRAYRRHDKDEHLLGALRDDFTDFRTLLSLQHLLAAQEGEVHALGVNGALKAKVTFAVADLVPAVLQELVTTLDFVPGKPKLSVALFTGVKASATVELSSGFELVVAKADADLFLVSLRKANTETRGANATFGVLAEVKLDALATSAELTALRNKLLRELLGGATLDTINELKEKAVAGLSWDDLPDLLKKAAEKIGEKLGERLTDKVVPQNLKNLVEKIDGIRDKIEAAVTKGVKKTLSFGISLAWSRVETKETLARGTLTAAELKKVHADLLRLETDTLRDIFASKSKGGEGVVFLDTVTLTQASSLAVGLDLGFFALKTETKRTGKWSLPTNVHGWIKPSYAVELSRSASVIKEDTGVRIALSSVSKDFHPENEVTVGGFSHSLQLGLEFADKNASLGEIRDYVDTAALWGGLAATPEAIQEAVSEIAAWKAEQGGRFKIAASFSVAPEGLATLWPILPDVKDVAGALAAAMGPSDHSDPVLRDIDARTALFTPIWSWVAGQKEGTYQGDAGRKKLASALSSLAEDHLKAAGYRILGNLEHAAVYQKPNRGNATNVYPTPNRAVASTLAFRVDNLVSRLHRVRTLGFDLATSTSTDWKTRFGQAGDDLMLLRYDPFYSRFYGRLLQQLALKVPNGKNLLKVSLVATATPAGGESQVLVIA